jgi:hypothetical protein
MNLAFGDWLVIVAYFVLAAAIGVAFTRRAGSSMTEFFVGGRSLPWWLAGTSMVATTFGTGRLIFGDTLQGTALLGLALLAFAWIARSSRAGSGRGRSRRPCPWRVIDEIAADGKRLMPIAVLIR